MIENAFTIMLFMWCVSFSVFGMQYVLGDVLGIEITNFRGEPVRPTLLKIIDQDEVNKITVDIVTGDYRDNQTAYDRVENYGVAAAFVAWELVQLLSGTYIFGFMYVMGIPLIFITFIVILYFALLARAIVGYIRGV